MSEEKKHEGLPVLGYSTQSDWAVDHVNANKIVEETILRMLDALEADKVDGRWLAISRTQFEQAFMALNRAIFQPARVKLEGDA